MIRRKRDDRLECFCLLVSSLTLCILLLLLATPVCCEADYISSQDAIDREGMATSQSADRSDRHELQGMKEALGAKEYLRLLADRVLDRNRFESVRRKVIAFSTRQQERKRKDLKTSARLGTASRQADDERTDDLRQGDDQPSVSSAARRENLKRLYEYLEQLGNQTSNPPPTPPAKNTTLTSQISVSKSISRSRSVTASTSGTRYILPLGVYDTVDVLSHVFTVNFLTYKSFQDFDDEQFAADLLDTILAAVDSQWMSSSQSGVVDGSRLPSRALLDRLLTFESLRALQSNSSIDNETLAVMKCIVANAANDAPQPLNFSLCRDDAAGERCTGGGTDGIMTLSTCKIPSVLGCSCPASLSYFPPSSVTPLRNVISLPNVTGSSEQGAINSTNREEQELEQADGPEPWLTRLRRLFRLQESRKERRRLQQVADQNERRQRRLLKIASSTLQVQFVFLLQYAASFDPRNVSDIASLYDELLNATVLAFQNDTLRTSYLIKGSPTIAALPLPYSTQTTSAPTTTAATTNAPQTNVPPTTPTPFTSTLVPQTAAPTAVVVSSPTEASSSAAYGFLALLIFPAALLGYAMYRLYEYVIWQRYTRGFSVKAKTAEGDRDDDDGGHDATMSGSGPLDIEVERSIGNAEWIKSRNKKDDADESRQWVEMTSSASFDPIQKNQIEQKKLNESATLAAAAVTATDAPADELQDDAAEVDDQRGPRRPITAKEHLRANAAVLARIQVALPVPPVSNDVTKAAAQQPVQEQQKTSAFSLLAAKKTSFVGSSSGPSSSLLQGKSSATPPSAQPSFVGNPLDEFTAVLSAGDAASKPKLAAIPSTAKASEPEYSDEEDEAEEEEGDDDDGDLR